MDSIERRRAACAGVTELYPRIEGCQKLFAPATGIRRMTARGKGTLASDFGQIIDFSICVATLKLNVLLFRIVPITLARQQNRIGVSRAGNHRSTYKRLIGESQDDWLHKVDESIVSCSRMSDLAQLLTIESTAVSNAAVFVTTGSINPDTISPFRASRSPSASFGALGTVRMPST